jgi:hypothetical protein
VLAAVAESRTGATTPRAMRDLHAIEEAGVTP